MDNSSAIEFKGISRLVEGTFSVTREVIPDGRYSLGELLALLVKGWLPYWECHKCGRFATCPHVERVETNPDRARDIQCGVAKLALRNFLKASWKKLEGFDVGEKQRFIDGLFHWTQYVLNAEIDIGSYTDDRLLSYRGNALNRRIMSYVSTNRRHLERFAYYFRDLSGFAGSPFWALVEGESEKAFLERLLELRTIDHLVLGVETYSGKGNRRLKKLHLEHLNSRGFKVVLQVDLDGKKGLEKGGFVEYVQEQGGTFFAFQPDFESVFPAPVLHRALELNGVEAPLDWLEGILDLGAGSVIASVEQRMKVRVSKTALARSLADLVEENLHILNRNWPNNAITQWVEYLRYGEGYDVLEWD